MCLVSQRHSCFTDLFDTVIKIQSITLAVMLWKTTQHGFKKKQNKTFGRRLCGEYSYEKTKKQNTKQPGSGEWRADLQKMKVQGLSNALWTESWVLPFIGKPHNTASKQGRIKVSGGETSVFRPSWKRLHVRWKTEDTYRNIMGHMVWKALGGRRYVCGKHVNMYACLIGCRQELYQEA